MPATPVHDKTGAAFYASLHHIAFAPCEGGVAPVSGLLQNIGQGHNRPNTRGFQAIFTK